MTGDRRDDLFERGSQQFEANEGGRGDPVSETIELSRSAVAAPASGRRAPRPTPGLVLLIAGAVTLGAASFTIVNAVRSDGSPVSAARPESTQAATSSAAEATQTTSAPEAAAAPVLGTLAPVAPEDTGEDVRRLQEALAELGLGPGTADGIYGDATAAAVAAFQGSVGLTQDGIAGPETIVALVEALTRS